MLIDLLTRARPSRRYSVGQELQEPKVGKHTCRRFSIYKKEKFDLLGHNFTGICTLVLLRRLVLLCLCLLGLCVCCAYLDSAFVYFFGVCLLKILLKE